MVWTDTKVPSGQRGRSGREPPDKVDGNEKNLNEAEILHSCMISHNAGSACE